MTVQMSAAADCHNLVIPLVVVQTLVAAGLHNQGTLSVVVRLDDSGWIRHC